MNIQNIKLTQAGKEDLALALLFLKDFKCDGKFDVDINLQILDLAKILGIEQEFHKIMTKLPPMKIVER